MKTLLLPMAILFGAMLQPVSALTIDDLKASALSGSGKTLELGIEGDGNGPNPGPTWTMTFEKSPSNQLTIRNFPGSTAASVATWESGEGSFPGAIGYVIGSNTAFGSKGGSIDFWISEPGARFYLTIDGASYYGGVTLKSAKQADISVSQPAGKELEQGGPRRMFGPAVVDGKGVTRVFTVRNAGKARLSDLVVRKSGRDKADFKVRQPGKTSLAAGAATTFEVTFKPTGKDSRIATLEILSNDPDESPFIIRIGGEGVK